ncbi:FG-GAP-like repeat-containing protein [Hymenobacter psychrotolerans]|nr:FG-GAP-like repeat-containing protein [Hymenobacter psychrotolerans]
MAQPTLVSHSPTANTRNAPLSTAVTATFTEPLTANSISGLKVYSAQRGGLLTRSSTPVTVSGNSLSFTPASAFKPGERVTAAITTATTSAAGSLAKPTVFQFTTRTAGTGRGNFLLGTNPQSERANDVVLGDVDGDGDLDMLIANNVDPGTVSVRLNGGDNTASNTGVFSGGTEVDVIQTPLNITLGDIDGDGDLDLVTGHTDGLITIRLNGGNNSGSNTGTFIGGTTLTIGSSVAAPVLSDADGDGDLDLLCADGVNNRVAIRLNGGNATGSNTGVFSAGTNVASGTSPKNVVAGDVDGDGDMDIVVLNNNGSTTGSTNGVTVRLNGGDNSGSNTGIFSNGTFLAIGSRPNTIDLADLDGDNDLDLVVALYDAPSAVIRLNGGDNTGSNTGTFTNGSSVAVPNLSNSAVLGDVDADGDIDLLTATWTSNSISVRLNGGDASGSNTGVFSGGSTLTTGLGPQAIRLSDVDGDGDIDMVFGNAFGASVGVRLNNPAPITGVQGQAKFTSFHFVIAPTVVEGSRLRFSYTNPDLDSPAVVTVYSITGQQLREYAVTKPGSGELLVNGLMPGWYLAKVRSGQSIHTARFCIN